MQLHIKSLSIAAGSRNILSEFSLHVPDRKWVAVLGPNGAGKTSLLRSIAGLISPTSGGIEVDSQPIREYSPKELAQRIGYVPQRLGDVPPFTVNQFLELSTLSNRSPHEPIVLSLVEGLYERQLPSLSGGELQRVMIAGALRQSASILLLDEPTNNLDPKGIQIVEQAISLLKKTTSISALVVTHDINFAVKISDTVTFIKEGRIVWSGQKGDPSLMEALSEVYEVPFTSVQDRDGRAFIVPGEELS